MGTGARSSRTPTSPRRSPRIRSASASSRRVARPSPRPAVLFPDVFKADAGASRGAAGWVMYLSVVSLMVVVTTLAACAVHSLSLGGEPHGAPAAGRASDPRPPWGLGQFGGKVTVAGSVVGAGVDRRTGDGGEGGGGGVAGGKRGLLGRAAEGVKNVGFGLVYGIYSIPHGLANVLAVSVSALSDRTKG